MTLLQLEYIVALDKHRHFRLAAESCHVTQPSLSTQIQKLEEELGVILFDRNVRPIAPTELGRQIIAHARVVLGEVARLQALVQEATGEMAGELRVGILSTIAPYLLPIVIAAFSRRYPNVTLLFEEFRTDQIVDRVQRDLLDAGLIATPVTTPDMVDVPLFVEPLVGYVARGHRLFDKATITADDLRADDLWLMSTGHCFRDQVLALLGDRAAEIPPQGGIRFESGNLETLQRLVDRGHGMTLLPWLAVTGEGSHAPESVRPFVDPHPTRTVRIAYARILPKRHFVRALIQEIITATTPFLPAGSVLASAE
ncbi:MAG TPA: LysR substrate-binding domain-containing protein [Rhodothermales bacterium]